MSTGKEIKIPWFYKKFKKIFISWYKLSSGKKKGPQVLMDFHSRTYVWKDAFPCVVKGIKLLFKTSKIRNTHVFPT